MTVQAKSNICPTCKGQKKNYIICPKCKGGKAKINCEHCKGKGGHFETCRNCNGSGTVEPLQRGYCHVHGKKHPCEICSKIWE